MIRAFVALTKDEDRPRKVSSQAEIFYPAWRGGGRPAISGQAEASSPADHTAAISGTPGR